MVSITTRANKYMFFYKGVDIVFEVLNLALLARVIVSWIPHDPFHPAVTFLHRITDPLLRPFQSILPAWKIGIDLSPIFAFAALALLKHLIFKFL